MASYDLPSIKKTLALPLLSSNFSTLPTKKRKSLQKLLSLSMANAICFDPFRFTTKLPNSLSPQFIPLLRPYPIRLNSFTNHNHNKCPKPFNFSPNCHATTTNSPLGFRKKTLNSIEYTINSMTHDDCGTQYGIARRRDEPISARCVSRLNPLPSDYRWAVEGRADCGSVEYTISSISNALNSPKSPAIAASLLGLLLMYNPNYALAAYGGIVGGRSFSQRSSTSVFMFLVSGAMILYTVWWMCLCYTFCGALRISGRFEVETVFLLFFVIVAFIPIIMGFGYLMATEKTSVIKLQVGLSGMTRSLQSVLNRIAETEDTSSQEGLNYILTETTLALLRHLDYSISAYSSFDIESSIEKGEKRFNQLSLQERGKFDEETLINVNNTSIKRPSTRSMRTSGFSNEYIVVTILVAVDGVYELPTINGSMDLNEALQKLGSVPSNKTMAVEVLWTPQNENDTLSERGLLKNYPLLKPL